MDFWFSVVYHSIHDLVVTNNTESNKESNMKYYEYLNGSVDFHMANLAMLSDELNQRVARCRKKSHNR